MVDLTWNDPRLSLLVTEFDNVSVSEGLERGASLIATSRERIWSFLRNLCPSLRPMDCDAQFSEIFTRRIFGHLSNEHKQAIVSTFKLSGTCGRCILPTSTEVDVFVHYLSPHTMHRYGLGMNNWYKLF